MGDRALLACLVAMVSDASAKSGDCPCSGSCHSQTACFLTVQLLGYSMAVLARVEADKRKLAVARHGTMRACPLVTDRSWTMDPELRVVS
jgi:hypothetical protein